MPEPVRLAHISDIHLTVVSPPWSWRDYCSKRLTGWWNVRYLARRSRFAQAERVAASLRRQLVRNNYDAVVFTGDATMLGFAAELEHAARMLGVDAADGLPGVAVPGNHDYYVHRAAASGDFERYFAPWQQGIRCGDHPYPFARRVGHVWLIGVQAAQPHVAFWEASGRIGDEQLDRLRQLCEQLPPGPRVVVTHYPLLDERRRPEPFYRRLRDWRAARSVAPHCRISLWLHGHRHRWYYLEPGGDLPMPTIGAGSSTQYRYWGYHEYAIVGYRLEGTRYQYNPATDAFEPAAAFCLTLPGGEGDARPQTGKGSHNTTGELEAF